MDLLEDLNVNFVMNSMIHKILAFLKDHLNYLKDNILECLFKRYNRLLFYFYFFLIIFFATYNDEKFKT